MRRGLERRLSRLHAPIDWQERADRERRLEWRGRVRMGEEVRACFAEWGIDPARAPILDWADEAAAELARVGDSDGLERADVAALGWGEDAANFYWAVDPWILETVKHYRADSTAEPDFPRASLAEIFAWCWARLQADKAATDADDRSIGD